MSNIMLNKACNLRCPYCFANEFVNNPESMKKHKNNISEENFRIALDFVVRSGETYVGLIGGEPTVHPEFEKLLNITLSNPNIHNVTLFTNGINIDKHFHLLNNEKLALLINFNSPNDIGEKNYQKLLKNLDYMIKELYMKDRISLGINMYKPDFDYMYIVEALKKYKFPHVRTAIAVPNTNEKKDFNAIEYFKEMKPRVFEFFGELLKIDCMPTYDCNLMPVCVTTPGEKKWLEQFWRMEERAKRRCNITDNPNCAMVIDILPNLEAVRCFGMSDFIKADIRDFNDIGELCGFFHNQIDALSYMIPTTDQCKNCYYRKTRGCSGGCLAFKAKQTKYMSNFIEKKYGMSNEI